MFGTHDLPLFILSGLLLNITPGADSLYIATRSVSQGVRAGFAAALGIGAGCFVHVFAAALGVSAILAASSIAFTVVKLAGAAYLVYMGLSLLRSKSAAATSAPTLPAASLPAVFWQGSLTNVLNPKVALFFLAFVPQFIESSAPSKVLAFLFLGTIFILNGTLWCLFLAWISSRLGALNIGSRATTWLRRSAGGLFVILGVRLALTKQG